VRQQQDEYDWGVAKKADLSLVIIAAVILLGGRSVLRLARPKPSRLGTKAPPRRSSGLIRRN
jgi:hypothetical protein